MAESMSEVILTIRKRDTVSLHGLMEETTKATGKEVSNTEKQSILTRQERLGKEYGRTVKGKVNGKK